MSCGSHSNVFHCDSMSLLLCLEKILEFLLEFGLFLAKSVTVLVAILITIAFIAGSSQRQKPADSGHIEVKNLNESLEAVTQSLKNMVLNPEARKVDSKQEKKRHKEIQKNLKKDAKSGVENRGRLFVVLALANFGQKTGFFARTLESA